jgi:general secretion pathway protein A
MYLRYYKLQYMPFQISPDPRFLWLGEKHKEALAVLKYGVLNNQGFVLLTGDVGTGKTTLINALVRDLGANTFLINIEDPRLDKLDFFKLVAHSLGLEFRLRTKFDFLVSFKDFLNRAHESKKNVLMIVDEAQKLSLDSLEEIRLLSNIERQDTKLLNVFFIGQDEFNDTLMRPECRALRQRITIVHHIESLNEKEMVQYVKYRLNVAGTQREIFTNKAFKAIFAFSKGYPRLINIICDRALLTGYSENLQTIGYKIIRECTRDLSLPGEMKQKTSRETAKRARSSLGAMTKAAILVGLVLFLALSGYVTGSIFSGNPGFSLRKYYTTLFGAIEKGPAERLPRKTGTQETDSSSLKAPLPSQPLTDTVPQQAEVTTNQQDKNLEMGSSASLKTSGQEDLFQKSGFVIPFGYNTNELPPEILTRLDELAEYMRQKADSDIVIKGFTDTMGSAEYNRNLSAFRANVVKSYLVGKGINPNRMKVIGMGDAAPRMPNKTSEGRAANRRVEIEFVARKP